MKKDSGTLKAQGELYDVYLSVRDLRARYASRRLSPPARGLLESLEGVAKTVMDAHRDGAVVDLRLDIYTPVPFPGFTIDLDGNVTYDQEGHEGSVVSGE